MAGRIKSLALVGNPGSGKSTILNGIAGRAHFPSGPNINTGKTSFLRKFEEPGFFTLFDTPGLADSENAEQAANEISKLLATERKLKLCFVVSLESGRPRSQDAETISKILLALGGSERNNQFGVIVNKLESAVLQELQKDETADDRIRNLLLGEEVHTTFWLYFPYVEALAGKENDRLQARAIFDFFVDLPPLNPNSDEGSSTNADEREIDASRTGESVGGAETPPSTASSRSELSLAYAPSRTDKVDYDKAIENMKRASEASLLEAKEEFEKEREEHRQSLSALQEKVHKSYRGPDIFKFFRKRDGAR